MIRTYINSDGQQKNNSKAMVRTQSMSYQCRPTVVKDLVMVTETWRAKGGGLTRLKSRVFGDHNTFNLDHVEAENLTKYFNKIITVIFPLSTQSVNELIFCQILSS